MKKPLFIFAAAMLLLTGCGGNTSNTSSSDNSSSSGSESSVFTESDEIVLTPELVDQNLAKDSEEFDPQKYATSALGNKSFEATDKFNINYQYDGLLIVTNKYNNVGFFSTVYSKYIVAPKYVKDWLSYKVYRDSVFGFVLFTVYEDKTVVYDSMGNVLFEKNDGYAYNVNSFTGSLINGKVYATLVIKGLTATNNLVTYNFSYENGSPNIIDELPEEDSTIDEDDIEEYDGPKAGDTYTNGSFDLSDYGYPGYYLYGNNGYYTTFDNSKKAVASFYVPVAETSIATLFGKNFLYQVSTEVSDDAVDYSYIDKGVKYVSHTYFVDIMEGTTQESDVNYVFDGKNIYTLKDSDGKYSYAVVSYREIDGKKLLGTTKTKIIDKDLVFHDNVSGVFPYAFIKLANGNYFNVATEILYSSKLEPLTYLNNLENLDYDPVSQTFIGSLKGKYGIINSNGKVVAEFRYDDILDDTVNGYFIGKENGVYYRIGTSNVSRNEIGKNLVRVRENLFYLFDSSTLVILSPEKDLNTFVRINEIDHLNYSLYGVGNGVTTFFMAYDDGDGNASYAVVSYRFDSLVKNSIDTVGEELLEEENNGFTTDTRVELKEGENNLHFGSTSSKYVYATYTPTRYGYVRFHLDDNVTLKSITDKSGNTVSSSIYAIDLSDNVSAYLLYSDETYNLTFSITSSYSLMGTVNVEVVDGSKEELPLVGTYDSTTYGYSFDMIAGTNRDYFLKFEVKEAGYYKFNSVSGVKVYLGDSDVTDIYMPLKAGTHTVRVNGSFTNYSTYKLTYTAFDSDTISKGEVLGYSENHRYYVTSVLTSGLYLTPNFDTLYVAYEADCAAAITFQFAGSDDSLSYVASGEIKLSSTDTATTFEKSWTGSGTRGPDKSYFAKGGTMKGTFVVSGTRSTALFLPANYFFSGEGENASSVKNLNPLTSTSLIATSVTIGAKLNGYYAKFKAFEDFDGTIVFNFDDYAKVYYAVNVAPSGDTLDDYTLISNNKLDISLEQFDKIYFYIDVSNCSSNVSMTSTIKNLLGQEENRAKALEYNKNYSVSGTYDLPNNSVYYYSYTSEVSWARQLNIHCYSNSGYVKFSFVYLQDGKEIKQSISCYGGRSDDVKIVLPEGATLSIKVEAYTDYSTIGSNWIGGLKITNYSL